MRWHRKLNACVSVIHIGGTVDQRVMNDMHKVIQATQ
jgi:hypothetical protein